MFENKIPSRVRVLVLGGGIHGVGVLHDLASRGWKDIHLLEKNKIGSGTSSKSTKLIHGGLRYLKRVSEFGMVRESLNERRFLLDIASDIVQPIELFLPVLRGVGAPFWVVRSGLFLYDALAGSSIIHKHKKVTREDIQTRIPAIDLCNAKRVYSFWDAQTDDLSLVNRVGHSAYKLGAGISEGVQVNRLSADKDGWLVHATDKNGRFHTISALYVINCLGPWAHELLNASHIAPTHKALNNSGVHLVLPDKGLKAGLLLQSPDDGRVFFVLPWLGKTLVGTTESFYHGSLDQIEIKEEEVNYLLKRCNIYFKEKVSGSDIEASFAGLRWLAVEDTHGLSGTSRESVVGEHSSHRGLMLTLYGGKLTSYRSLSERIGDRVTSHFGEYSPSKTLDKSQWVASSDVNYLLPSVGHRFS